MVVMPNKEVHLRRWQVVAAFLLLIFSFVAAVFLVDRESKARSAANLVLIESSTRNRAEITYTGCLDQNNRHDTTIKRLDEILQEAVQRNPAIQQQARESRQSTIFIIEALAPHQNCKQLVLDRFGFVPELPVVMPKAPDQ